MIIATLSKKREFTFGLVAKISFVYGIFTLAFIVLLLNKSLLAHLEHIDIQLHGLFISKGVKFISKLSLFQLFSNSLGINLTPNVETILAMLILSYVAVIFMILLSFFFNIFILPLTIIVGGLFGLIFRLSGNYMFQNYTLIDFRSFKIMKILTDEEKIGYLRNIKIQYESNLSANMKVKGYNFDEVQLLLDFNGINDIDIIKLSFFRSLESYTVEVWNNEAIRSAINRTINLCPEDMRSLIDGVKIFQSIKDSNLEVPDEVVDFILLSITNQIKDLSITNVPGFNWDFLNIFSGTSPATSILYIVLGCLVLGGISFLGYQFYISFSMKDILKEQAALNTSNLDNIKATLSESSNFSDALIKWDKEFLKTYIETTKQNQQAILEAQKSIVELSEVVSKINENFSLLNSRINSSDKIIGALSSKVDEAFKLAVYVGRKLAQILV